MTKVSDKMQGEIFKYTYDEKLKKEIVVLKKEQIFNDVKHFREVMQEFVRQEGFPIKKFKNDKTRFVAVCKDNGCGWSIHAFLYGDGITFKIKQLGGSHTCIKSMKGCGASSRWIAKLFESDFRADYGMSIDKFYVSLKEKHGLDVNTQKLIRAIKIVKELVARDHAKSYAKIPQYIAILKETNAGVDACLLKGPFKGQLLVAVSLDANSGFVKLSAGAF
ncbi:uncharacterized protein LOC132061359 [Lycium ferocissimum]|uniref:uncharacterized protein LOC132061359 n=1 Tax=Lycium ferocissimum TaxID=112874 RepID=UPI0028156039|nr:uncharacterized protein LOC132061359 [Lycium ferocissimum]